MEESVAFGSAGHRLEGRLQRISADKAALITHPHTLYGGDMDNAVVAVLTQACEAHGWTTLRFNFRGAGESQGHCDNGLGEQDDAAAAIDFLLGQGVKRIALAGYSFGAWVLARWSQRPAVLQAQHIGGLVLVAPPVAFLDFAGIGRIRGLRRVIAGSEDEIAPPSRIAPLLPLWQPDADLKIIPGADHFFGGYFRQLQALVGDVIG
jgi:alpha/beta superfamily hydrolase